ncbi:hypothetical protein D8Y22_20400 [Salinadaptatus halalkaliphilus]|uniref:Lipoprotein n=1 Tax=Salinadaptatus halalkaliphilus TaxID=2419781 RepID=A0A4S3TIY8_9EURY|nr:nitrous oxide reductase accessory protein NosL [Salinadaptatus halalkaliphilus]THE62825.1 hypothetical protein D8Y22_20400 [Salinadaptatus halalkaliphilus]
MTNREGRLGRRRLLGLLGAGATVGAAGCLDGDGTDGDGDEQPDDGDDDEREVITLEHPGDEPILFTDSQNCQVCNMTPTHYSDWQSQLAHEGGEGVVFCTPGCLGAYYVSPTDHNGPDSDIVGVWTTDYETGDLIDATEASFVIVTDDTTVDDPMGLNPRPFADHEAAVSFAESWDPEDLTEDDIVDLEEIDYDIATIYRGNRMPVE